MARYRVTQCLRVPPTARWMVCCMEPRLINREDVEAQQIRLHRNHRRIWNTYRQAAYAAMDYQPGDTDV